MDLGEIEVLGDYPLEAVREKTRDFEFCMERIDDYFGDDSNLTSVVGRFPEEHSRDYCWGGCPGALQEAMHVLRGYHPNVDREMAKITYVVGEVDGPLDLEPDERVIFAGDCTNWEGKIGGEEVKIRSRYRTTRDVDERKTRSNDMLLRTAKTLFNTLIHGKSRYIRVRGCTLSVADHIHYLSSLGRIRNVNFDPRLVIPVNIAYWRMRLKRFWNRLLLPGVGRRRRLKA